MTATARTSHRRLSLKSAIHSSGCTVMRVFGHTVFLFAGVLIGNYPAQAMEPNELFKLASPSIVVVLASDAKGEKGSLGSGVIVAPLEILTSCKVVESAADIVVTQGNTLRKARLRFQDGERDLCQLHIDDPLPAGKPAVAATSSTMLEIGQDVFAISSPQGLDRTLSRVMISGLREAPGVAGRLIQIEMTVSPGSSGGGIFDQDAKLVGLITSQLKRGGSNYAAPVDWFAELATRSPDQMLVTESKTVPAKTAPIHESRPAWMPRVGERWKYRLSHGKRQVTVVTVEIIEARDSMVRERITFDRSKGFNAERDVSVGFNPVRFENLIVLPGGYQIAEVSPYASPDTLFARNQSWGNIPGEFALQGAGRKKALSKMHVVAQEKVRVPSSEFNAWKIETVSERMEYNGVFFTIKCVFWYAPEMKRAVRMNIVTESSVAVISNNELYELVAFEPAK